MESSFAWQSWATVRKKAVIWPDYVQNIHKLVSGSLWLSWNRKSMNHIKTPELPSKQVLGSPPTDPLTDNEPASQSCQPRAHLITLTNARHQTWSTISFDGNFPFFLSVWKATESYCLRTPGEYLSKHSLYTRRNWSTERLRDMPDDTANYV